MTVKQNQRKYLYHLIAMCMFCAFLWISFSLESAIGVLLSSLGIGGSVLALQYYEKKIWKKER